MKNLFKCKRASWDCIKYRLKDQFEFIVGVFGVLAIVVLIFLALFSLAALLTVDIESSAHSIDNFLYHFGKWFWSLGPLVAFLWWLRATFCEDKR